VRAIGSEAMRARALTKGKKEAILWRGEEMGKKRTVKTTKLT